jgi:hypothetical protein
MADDQAIFALMPGIDAGGGGVGTPSGCAKAA